MSPLSFVGLPITVLFLLQTTTPPSGVDPFIETLKNLFVVLGTIFIPVLWDYVRRTRKEQKEAQAIAPTKQDVKDVADHAQEEHAKLLGKITELQREQERTNKVIDQLTADLNETRKERDEALKLVETNKATYDTELEARNKEKVALTEQLEDERKITTSLSEQNEDQEQRIQTLEQTIKGLTPMNEMVQMILSGMSQAVTAGLTAYAATLPKLATSEQKAITPATQPEMSAN